MIIAHDCEINTDQTVFYVVVNEGKNLTVNDGATLTSRRITTEGSGQVIIEDGAQLYSQSEGVQATVKKSVAAHGSSGGWHFISSSLATDVAPSTDNHILSSTPENYDLYFYDEPAHYWRNYKESDNSLYSGFSIEPMKGYLYANSDGTTLSFAGTLQPGITATTAALSYQAQTLKGWNLVGNPFPCNVYVNKSYYTMNADGTAIEPEPVSSTTGIPSCTGIMVKAEAEDETVVFSKDVPETVVNQGNIQIAVVQNNTRGTTMMDKAIVSFNAGDELGKFVFNNDNAKLYIPQGNEDYAIACAEKQGEMPLNFVAKENGNYTLSVNPENVEMSYLHLIDNMTGADVDLLATPDYTFTAKTDDYASRFRLVFNANDASTESASDAPFAYYVDGEIRLVVETSHGASLQIVDMMGRVIVSRGGRIQCVPISGMTSGVYVLRLIDGDNIRTQKIVID